VAGQRGVSHLLELFASDMRVTMTLIGAKAVHEITGDNLAAERRNSRRKDGTVSRSAVYCRRPNKPFDAASVRQYCDSLPCPKRRRGNYHGRRALVSDASDRKRIAPVQAMATLAGIIVGVS
jgi:hypothetical protein